MFTDARIAPVHVSSSYTLTSSGLKDFLHCLKEVCARAYIARTKQIEAKRKRKEPAGEATPAGNEWAASSLVARAIVACSTMRQPRCL